jgi:hypothetical protein
MDLIRELHKKGLGGNFGIDETKRLVRERYFWPSINKDVISLLSDTKFVNLPKEGVKTHDFIHHYQYLRDHWKI